MKRNKENNQFSSGKNRPKLDHQVCDIHLRSDQADNSENRTWLLTFIDDHSHQVSYRSFHLKQPDEQDVTAAAKYLKRYNNRTVGGKNVK